MALDIAIVGCGMVTPVGLSAQETAASARSRTARLTEIEWRDSRFKRFVVGTVLEDGLPPVHSEIEKLWLSYRETRMLRLSQPALIEAVAPLPKTVASVPVLLGLPELHTTVPVKGEEFLGRLALQTGVRLNVKESLVFPRGRASGLLAVREACNRLAQGKEGFLLAGGVDSYLDLYVLGTLDMQKRIRTEVNPDGFAPAEGAAFLLLTGLNMAQRHGLRVLAKISGFSAAKEEGHIYSDKPYKGEALSGPSKLSLKGWRMSRR